MASPRKPQIIPPSRRLRDIAVNATKGFGLRLSPREIEHIEKAIEKSQDRFSTEAVAKLRLVRAQLGAIEEGASGNRGGRDADLAALNRLIADVSLELKGLGGTFGYPLLTAVAKSLHDFLDGRETLDAVRLEIVRHHLDAMYRVIAERLKGLGGDREAALLKAFHQATEQYR